MKTLIISCIAAFSFIHYGGIYHRVKTHIKKTKEYNDKIYKDKIIQDVISNPGWNTIECENHCVGDYIQRIHQLNVKEFKIIQDIRTKRFFIIYYVE